MDIWFVLGIEPTKDMEAIRDAYRARLLQVNPEDDPEGFKELRAAFEEANRLAGEEDRTEEGFDDTPVGQWMQQVDAVYQDYWRRIDGEAWDELLADDVCFGLDSKEEAEEALLRYLADHHLLPHCIWHRIETFFEIQEHEEELTEQFPKDFLEYVINNAKYEDHIDYALFEERDPELPYDQFLTTYIRMVGALQERDLPRAENLLGQLEELPLHHPFLGVQKVRLLMSRQDYEQAAPITDDLVKRYPDLVQVRMMEAEFFWNQQDYEQAALWYQRVLELDPEYASARCGIADCLMGRGDYVGAKVIYKELLNSNRFDTYVHKCMMDCNEKLIPFYEDRLAGNPADDESRLELAWCYYQNYQFQQAYDVLKDQERTDIYALDFSYLRGRCLLQMERRQEAGEAFWNWVKLFPAFSQAEGEEGKRNRDREGLTYFFIAELEGEEEHFEEALRVNDLGLEHAQVDRGMILTQRGNILFHLERYQEAVDVLGQALELEPNNFDAFICRGECMEKMERYQDALDDYDEAIHCYPYYIKPYIQQAKIFLQFEMCDQAEQVLDRFDQFEMQSDQLLLYRARICREKGKCEEGWELLQKLEEQMADQEHLSDLSEKDVFYHERALNLYYQNGEGHMEQTCEALKKALECNPREPRYHYFYGNVLWEMDDEQGALGQFEKALEVGGENANVYFQMAGVYHDLRDDKEEAVLKKVLDLYPEHDEANGRLGQFYEQKKRNDLALEYYSRQLEQNPTGYYYVARGLIYFQMGKNAESMADYQSALDLNDDNAYANYNMGRIHMALGNLEEAKLLFERAIRVAERPTEIFYRYLAKCYNRMGRYEQAVEVLQQQIDQGVNLLNGYYNLARIHKLNMNAPEALKALKAGKALKNSGSRDFDKQAVYIYVEILEDMAAAEKKLRTMKRARPDDSETKEAYAFYYHETAQYHKEYKILSQVKKFDATDWHDIVKCLLGLGGQRFSTIVRSGEYKKQLMEAFEKTKELAKADLEDYEVRALALKALAAVAIDERDLQAAKEYLEEMSRTQLCDHCFHGQCCEYYHQLARYELACGNRERALAAAKKACEIAPDDKEFRELAKELEQ